MTLGTSNHPIGVIMRDEAMNKGLLLLVFRIFGPFSPNWCNEGQGGVCKASVAM